METIQTPLSGRLASAPLPTRARVLVVDDESRIRMALRACLEAEHYEVHEAADGLEALAAVEQTRPQLIILDLSMPRLSGLETLAELEKRMGDAMPGVIVLTAYGSSYAQNLVCANQTIRVLEKPLLPDVLRRAVEQALQRMIS